MHDLASPIQTLSSPAIAQLFPQLLEIPHPPEQLHVRGNISAWQHDGDGALRDRIPIVFVGSRNCTPYGADCCRSLIAGLRGYPVCIVSGLAIGIDAIAHESALEFELPTIAFPGSGLDWDALYPARHYGLAERILASPHGGLLCSEFTHDTRGARWTFPQRNRLMAGMARMVIIIEAQARSGTLITATLATEYNRIVGAVPGSIHAPHSTGCNNLLRQGASVICSVDDILQELRLVDPAIDPQPKRHENTAAHSFSASMPALTDEECRILHALDRPRTKDDIAAALGLSAQHIAIACSSLEIRGLIKDTIGIVERHARGTTH